ncbi:glycosyltransferase [Candidatus Woesearchaeota archaeon]|nr:glycosyltransferase [Candidatus Woesearchaeota archaeon]
MLSIIIPARNEEHYLPKLLESLRRQTFKDFEVIVADCHSQDKTKEIARKFGCKITKGGLPAEGRANGAKAARGDRFFFIDADCELGNDFLEKTIHEFNRRTLDVAACLIVPLEKSVAGSSLFFLYNAWVIIVQRIAPHAAGCAILCKRQVYDSCGGFRPSIKMYEEHDFVMRARKHGKFRVLYSRRMRTSLRRFKRDGFFLTLSRLFLSWFLRLVSGELHKDIFGYFKKDKRQKMVKS